MYGPPCVFIDKILALSDISTLNITNEWGEKEVVTSISHFMLSDQLLSKGKREWDKKIYYFGSISSNSLSDFNILFKHGWL